MPTDWDAFDRALQQEVDDAAERTSERLASRASSLTRLTDEEVLDLFPKTADVKRLSKLMEIVKAAESRNDKINRLTENIEDLAGVTLTILEKFA